MHTDLRAHCEFTISTTCGSEQGMRKRCAVPLRTRWMVRSSQVGKESQDANSPNSPLRGFQSISRIPMDSRIAFFLGKVDTVELRLLRVCWYTWKVAAVAAFVLLQIPDMWFSWWSVGRCTMLHVLPVWFIVILEAYGWLPPIDDPKLGFGRGNLYHRDAMVLLAGYMTLHGHMGWGEWHDLSYLQVISKLSPSHPVIRPFLLTSKGTTPTLVFEGVNMCERCRADVLLVIFTVVCWQLHIFSVSCMMFHAQGRVQRIAFFQYFSGAQRAQPPSNSCDPAGLLPHYGGWQPIFSSYRTWQLMQLMTMGFTRHRQSQC